MEFEPPPDSLGAHFRARANFVCTLKWVGVFLDLLWPPTSNPLEQSKQDPAFIVEGFSRYVALARVGGELRYFAMGLEPRLRAEGADSGPRFEAALREGDGYEMGVLLSPDDAVDFAAAYLRGVAVDDIPIARRVVAHRP